MAYYSGSAVDMAGVRTALLTACQAEGWTLAGSVLHKAGTYVQVDLNSGSLRLLGGTGISGSNVLTGATAQASHIVATGSLAVTWPATWEIFAFEQEVYLVVNFSVDRFQWACFGKSTLPLPGTAGFVAASFGSTVSSTIAMGTNGNTAQPLPLPFWYGYTGNTTDISRIHTGIDGAGWTVGADYKGGGATIGELIGVLPNAWNSEAVLLPIRAYLGRPSNKFSLVLDLEYARYTRIDNHQPGELITLGGDSWKVFPGYRKDASARDGGSSISHTGTFGWAIRYEGP